MIEEWSESNGVEPPPDRILARRHRLRSGVPAARLRTLPHTPDPNKAIELDPFSLCFLLPLFFDCFFGVDGWMDGSTQRMRVQEHAEGKANGCPCWTKETHLLALTLSS